MAPANGQLREWLSCHDGYPARACHLTSDASLSTNSQGPTVERKKPTTTRRVWRITADSPRGEFVDFDPTAPATDPVSQDPRKVLDPAPVVDWRSSSYDLLNGLEVRDHSDAIPGALFERLFKR